MLCHILMSALVVTNPSYIQCGYKTFYTYSFYIRIIMYVNSKKKAFKTFVNTYVIFSLKIY